MVKGLRVSWSSQTDQCIKKFRNAIFFLFCLSAVTLSCLPLQPWIAVTALVSRVDKTQMSGGTAEKEPELPHQCFCRTWSAPACQTPALLWNPSGAPWAAQRAQLWVLRVSGGDCNRICWQECPGLCWLWCAFCRGVSETKAAKAALTPTHQVGKGLSQLSGRRGYQHPVQLASSGSAITSRTKPGNVDLSLLHLLLTEPLISHSP